MSRPILAQSQGPAADPAVNAYVDTIPGDLEEDKTQAIKEAIELNEKEAAAFWPVYKMYGADEAKLDEERRQVAKRYADTWTTLTDAEARDLARQSLALESRRGRSEKSIFRSLQPGMVGAHGGEILSTGAPPGFARRLEDCVRVAVASGTVWKARSAYVEITSFPVLSWLLSILRCVCSASPYSRR